MSRKNKNVFENKILNVLQKNKDGLSSKSLSNLIQVHKSDYHKFRNALEKLKKQKRIQLAKGTKIFTIIKTRRNFTGELCLTKSGYGFVTDEENSEDVFIGRDHLNTAFNKDIVEIKLYANYKGKRKEGFVTKVIKRSRTNFVGTFHLTEYYGYVVPDDKRIYRDFYIPKEKYGNAINGQKVVVSMDSWQRDHLNPEGTIIEIIGYPGEKGVDIASIVHSFQLGLKFSEQVEKDAKKTEVHLSKLDLRSRLDLRNEECITIDPDDAKDFDDAVSLEVLKNGNYLLGVHIADVSHYVKEQSEIDKEAFNRGTSVYLVDRVIPMLPEHLSNNLCSLKPNEDRLTFSCIMELNPEGDLVNYNIQPSVIHSKRRFNYEEVQQIIDTQTKDPFFPLLDTMMRLSKFLTNKRLNDGGIDFETPEVTFELDDKGFPVSIKRKTRLDSHRLIEEFMLLANKTVAEHIKKISTDEKMLPFIYRIHEKPDQAKMKKLIDFLFAIGYKRTPGKKLQSDFFQKLLSDIKGSKEEIVIEEIALRSMMKAIYSPKNIGHFGLGFEDYTHFTSPIRRYPDLVVHRLLKLYLDDSTPKNRSGLQTQIKKICDQSSAMERLALEAERESIRLKQNEYISQHIGEEFEGVISGVMSFGIFVELIETLGEGLVHITDLDDDYYIFDEKSYSLIGRDTNRLLRLGDKVRICVEKVNLEVGKVDFRLVAE